MDSELSESTRIFYGDKEDIEWQLEQNKLEGPHNLKEMQLFYTQNTLTSSDIFFVTEESCTPTVDSPRFTLAELCSLHGNRFPFKWSEQLMRSKRQKLRKRTIDSGKMPLPTSERSKSDTTEIICFLSKFSLKALSQQDGKVVRGCCRDASANSFNFQRSSDVLVRVFMGILNETETERIGVSELDFHIIKDSALFFLSVCKYLSEKNVAKIILSSYEDRDLNVVKVFISNHEQRNCMISKYSKGMKNTLYRTLNHLIGQAKDFYFCAPCDRFMFTARQTLMHIGSPSHIAKMREQSETLFKTNEVLINMIGEKRVKRMFEQEEQQRSENSRPMTERESYSDEFRPTAGFLLQFAIPDESLHCGCARCASLPVTKQACYKWLKEGSREDWQGAPGIAKWEELKEHMGTGKARCLCCNLIFAGAAEYYAHVVTFGHIRAAASAHDMVTLVVNVHTQRVGERSYELPIPE